MATPFTAILFLFSICFFPENDYIPFVKGLFSKTKPVLGRITEKSFQDP
jgi:hypothetical protein